MGHRTGARPRVVIVGAGYAGLTAAHRLGGRADVTVVSPTDSFVDRIRLHQFATGERAEDDVVLPLSDVLPPRARHVQGCARAVTTGTVLLSDGRQLHADHILVAAGSGVGSGVTNLESSRAVRRELQAAPGGSAVRIDGAGHTGVELAAELAERRPDLSITVVDPAGLLPGVNERARRKAHRHLAQSGVTVSKHADTEGPSPRLVIDCTGFATPSIEGVADPDDTLSFGAGLWVAGDMARTGHRWSCAAAEPMGAHAADNILAVAQGAQPRPLRFGFALQCISLGRHDGLVQGVHADDTPRNLVLGGSAAAMVKERISRMARRVATGGSPRYRWPSGPTIAEVRSTQPLP